MKRVVAVGGALVAFAVPWPAHADVLPRPPSGTCGQTDAISACNGKAVGQACTYGSTPGACQALRCTNDAGETMLACSPTSSPSDDSGGCAVGPNGPQGGLGALAALLVALALARIMAARRARSS